MKVLFVVYDNDSYISQFPIGIAQLVASVEDKHEVDIWFQDIHHYPDSDLTKLLNKTKYDVVGLSFIGGYYQHNKAIALSEAINKSKNRPFYMIGGHGPAPEPEYFMKMTGADAISLGEGDETIVDLLDAVEKKRDLKEVKGIAYRNGDSCVINEKRPLIEDIDSLPLPAYHRFPMEVYRLLRMPNCTSADFVVPMLSGRGCPFKCNFCYRMDEGFRPRSNDRIIEEMKLLKRDFGITYVAFFDELLMSSEKRTISLCRAMIDQKVDMRWECCGRLNFAKPAVLEIMKEAGCVFINYGIEAFDDVVLKNMRKALTVKQIVAGVEATLAVGISPGLNMIFGNYGDNKDTLRKGVEFLLKYDDGAQLRTMRPVTPYPGSELYYNALRDGQLDDCADFYKKHANSDLMAVNFTDLTDDEFYEALYEANETLLMNYSKRVDAKNKIQLDKLYGNKDASFRGFRHN